MTDLTIADVRAKFPQYDDLDDCGRMPFLRAVHPVVVGRLAWMDE